MKEFKFYRREGEVLEDGTVVTVRSGLLPSIGRFFIRGAERVTNGVLVGKMYPEERHPISRILFKVYGPPAHWVLRHPRKTIAIALLVVIATIPIYKKLGHEFMPPLNEGSILYMPTTLPGISVGEATSLLQRQDQLLKTFPEVERVFGKAGRADTSTDPAPFAMMETVVVLKPTDQWRTKERWYSDWPDFIKPVFRPLWPETMSWDELVNEMNGKLTLPGQTNAWTMPIKNRTDMLTTGIRTPIGVKIFGSDLKEIEQIGQHLEGVLQTIPGTRSVYGERTAGGYFVDFDLNREQIARYGLTIKEVQDVIMTAIGGENVSTTIEGRERYPVNIRYPRELREDVDQLARVLVPTMGGAQVPLGQLATIKLLEGPSMIRDEDGKLSGYVSEPRCMADRTARMHQARASSMEAAMRVSRPTGVFSRPRSYRILASMGNAVSDSAPPTNRANWKGLTSGSESRSYRSRPAPKPSSSEGTIPETASTDALRTSPCVRPLWSSPAPTRNM
jgi:Cu/Ag efflux pump CusA